MKKTYLDDKPPADRFQREDPLDPRPEHIMSVADESNVRASVVLEYNAMLTGKVNELGEVGDKFNKLMKEFYAKCDEIGVSVVKTNGFIRGLTKEETLAIVPRKWHFAVRGRHICETPFVSKKFLTKDKEKVTCKNCLRKLAEMPEVIEKAVTEIEAQVSEVEGLVEDDD